MKAVCSVIVGGVDVTANFLPVLISLSVADNAGASSDTASLELDDRGGQLIMPEPGAPVVIKLGWEHSGVGTVFEGVVDEVRAKGGRGGRTVSVSAKGMDTRAKAKQGQRRHFDNETIESAMQEAGRFAGISVKVDPSIASIVRPYLALDDESFVAFGERMARELGGTFKIVGDKAILAKRNGGTNPSGTVLPTVAAAWGDNLHEYDISPILGRPVEKQTLSRWFDPKAAEWLQEVAETGTAGGITTKPARFAEPDMARAKEQAASDAAESDRKSGEGSVTIEGNINAQPEGICVVSGCRPGADGRYRIDSVKHDYSRGGFITSLELGQPKGAAGKDSRGRKSAAEGGGDGLALPAHPTLG